MAQQRVVKVKPAQPRTAQVPQAQVTLLGLLVGQGFRAEYEVGVGISFMFEGGRYYLPEQGGDGAFYHLLFPNFWPLESDEEYGRALLACDTVNREAKLVKLHAVDADVWAGVEVLHGEPEAFMAFLPRYLEFTQDAVRTFREVMLAVLDGEDALADGVIAVP